MLICYCWEFISSTGLSEIPTILKQGPVCTWQVLLLALALEMLVFICGERIGDFISSPKLLLLNF